jgi:pre-rRNA-processing protein TSR2
VQHHWGGPDSEDKRDWFAGVVVDLFPDFAKQKPSREADSTSRAQDATVSSADEPESADVEAVLLQVMLDEFEVNVDDDSSFETADQIMRLRNDIAKGKSEEFDRLEKRWKSRQGAKVDSLFKKGDDEEHETDWDTDDEDGEDNSSEGRADVRMTDAPPPRKEKPEPEVDEDGFTTVRRKNR